MRHVLALLVVAGCTKDQPQPAAASPTSVPMTMTSPASPHAQQPPQAPAAAPPMAPPASGDLAGVVIETMGAGGYTYAKIDRGGSQAWLAGPTTKLAVGSKISASNPTLMQGFRSDTLKRTFDEIYFVNAISVGGGAMADAHASPVTVAPSEPVARLDGGKTIAEIFAGKDALSTKPVAVRGKVVKVNNGILGKNWLHIQDGSGGASSNDLVVTTQDTANKGDVVVVRGTVSLDKDFGAGYKYNVMIEDATLAAK